MDLFSEGREKSAMTRSKVRRKAASGDFKGRASGDSRRNLSILRVRIETGVLVLASELTRPSLELCNRDVLDAISGLHQSADLLCIILGVLRFVGGDESDATAGGPHANVAARFRCLCAVQRIAAATHGVPPQAAMSRWL